MNIYVSNLMSQTTDEDLKKLFSAHGQVASCRVVADRYTGVSRGFGFVEMPQDAEGNAAIRALDGKSVDGRNISVAVARERSDRSFSDRRRSY